MTGFKPRQVYKWLWDENKRLTSEGVSQKYLDLSRNTYQRVFDRMEKVCTSKSTYALDRITVFNGGAPNPVLQGVLKSIEEKFLLCSPRDYRNFAGSSLMGCKFFRCKFFGRP